MEDYSAKITGEPFLYSETKLIGKYLLDGYDVESLKKKNIEENLIMYKSINSISRVNYPIFRRLGVMDKDMLEFFLDSDIVNSKCMLLYSIMKTDRLFFDFMNEVYMDRLLFGKEYIEKFEIDNWYEEKELLSSSLKSKCANTAYKIKQVIMKILVDSGLVIKDKKKFKIVRPLLKQNFIDLLSRSGDFNYAKVIGGLL